MKRAAAIALAFVLLLSGCAKKESPKNLPNEDINCSFTAKIEDMTFSGNLYLPVSGNAKIEFESPMELAGMTLEISGDNVIINHLGMKMEIPISQHPALSAGNTIISALSSARQTGVADAKQTEKGYLLSGKTSFGEYKLLVDEQLKPLELTALSKDFICEFN